MKNNKLKHWVNICLSPLTSSEIIEIINQKYPSLASIASRMVSILDIQTFHNQVNLRIPSVRDILKWCNRCHKYFKTGDRDIALRVFHDAVDIFCGFMEKGENFI